MDPNKKFGAAEIVLLFKGVNKEICELQAYMEECCSKVPVNIGTGFGLYKKFSQNKWQFKSLVAGNNINITDDGYDLTITGIAEPLDCDDIKDCIGINPSGDPNKYLNEQGDWVTITVTVSDTNTVDLDVIANNLTANVLYQNTSTINLSEDPSGLKADFASMNISQFTNDSGYLKSTDIISPFLLMGA